MSAQPQPKEIYARAREEGRRRLSRPLLELVATALVGGFDVAFGVVAFALVAGAVAVSASGELASAVVAGALMTLRRGSSKAPRSRSACGLS